MWRTSKQFWQMLENTASIVANRHYITADWCGRTELDGREASARHRGNGPKRPGQGRGPFGCASSEPCGPIAEKPGNVRILRRRRFRGTGDQQPDGIQRPHGHRVRLARSRGGCTRREARRDSRHRNLRLRRGHGQRTAQGQSHLVRARTMSLEDSRSTTSATSSPSLSR